MDIFRLQFDTSTTLKYSLSLKTFFSFMAESLFEPEPQSRRPERSRGAGLGPSLTITENYSFNEFI